MQPATGDLDFTFFYVFLDSAYPYAGDDADAVFSARCNWLLVRHGEHYFSPYIMSNNVIPWKMEDLMIWWTLIIPTMMLCSGQDATGYW